MITLELNKAHQFKVGEVVHLKVVAINERGRGKWQLRVEDVTPLPGAEPTDYGCHVCGIIEEAKPDGSLPDGWVERKYEEGSCFVCSDKMCQKLPICRVCGCTNEQPCGTEDEPCHWVESDLCSACVGKDRGKRDTGKGWGSTGNDPR